MASINGSETEGEMMSSLVLADDSHDHGDCGFHTNDKVPSSTPAVVEETEVEIAKHHSKPTLSLDDLKSKMEQESLEFAFLKPICAQVLQNPSLENLKVFEAALNEVGNIPDHLSEFVVFPFAIHLKVIKNYKEMQRIQIYQSLAKLLGKLKFCKSYDMFVNIFQKLYFALSPPNDPTKVNKQMAEEEIEAIISCSKNLTLGSLSYHIDTLCLPDKLQILGHSIFLLLQLIAPDLSKCTRIKALQVLEKVVQLCDGSEIRSKTLLKFLPGIISSLRKVSLPSAGNSVKLIILKSLDVMGMTVRISIEFEKPENMEQADAMLSQIVGLLSTEFVLNSDVDFRKSFLHFCCEITTRNTQLPNCCKSISTILMRMKEDEERTISDGCVEALQTEGMLQKLSLEDLVNLVNSALSSLGSGNQVACVLALREISSTLSSIKLSFVEFQSFLPLLFQFINEMVWKTRSISVEKRKTSDPIYIASCKVCQSIVSCTDADEVAFEFMSILSDMQNNSHVRNSTGIVFVFNVVLSKLHEINSKVISDFEAINLAEIYLSLLDLQSTEIALQNIETEIPAVQTAADILRSYLLEGLGILGQIYPDNVLPVVLYPLIEHAGTSFLNAENVNEIAEEALKRLSGQSDLEIFFKEKRDMIFNEISVRMLNLFLYPNCPHAMIFLARYFDFSDESFSALIDQIFERCSDNFGGGDSQHIYVKVYYALLMSISNHFTSENAENSVLEQSLTLLQKMLNYQKAVGVKALCEDEFEDNLRNENEMIDDYKDEGEEKEENWKDEVEVVLSPVLLLVERICHRLLNFLPSSERAVKLTAMDSLILGIKLLKSHENSLLPLCHSIWQNLIPRIEERDYVIVRKSFELLKTLCSCSGSFLRKRTIEEAFPKLSVLILNLAKEGEQVKVKNRQYYTCTQAYKLQLTILQGMGEMLQSIDVQEFELDRIVSGCILYLNPDQHKNLRDAAIRLLENIASGKHCRTVWMKLIACNIVKAPTSLPDPSFTPFPGIGS